MLHTVIYIWGHYVHVLLNWVLNHFLETSIKIYAELGFFINKEHTKLVQLVVESSSFIMYYSESIWMLPSVRVSFIWHCFYKPKSGISVLIFSFKMFLVCSESLLPRETVNECLTIQVCSCCSYSKSVERYNAWEVPVNMVTKEFLQWLIHLFHLLVSNSLASQVCTCKSQH